MRPVSMQELATYEAIIRQWLAEEPSLGYRRVCSRMKAAFGVEATPQTTRSLVQRIKGKAGRRAMRFEAATPPGDAPDPGDDPMPVLKQSLGADDLSAQDKKVMEKAMEAHMQTWLDYSDKDAEDLQGSDMVFHIMGFYEELTTTLDASARVEEALLRMLKRCSKMKKHASRCAVIHEAAAYAAQQREEALAAMQEMRDIGEGEALDPRGEGATEELFAAHSITTNGDRQRRQTIIFRTASSHC
jgi:hypothetical protein